MNDVLIFSFDSEALHVDGPADNIGSNSFEAMPALHLLLGLRVSDAQSEF
jgi:hypothetical protein